MKLDTRRLFRPMSIKVEGTEPWLEAIYKDCPQPQNQDDGKLTADITVSPEDLSVRVAGQLTFCTSVRCYGCETPIDWPMDLEFSIDFWREPEQRVDAKEVILCKSDLSQYFLENDQIDIEEILNEQVQLDLPTSQSDLLRRVRCPNCLDSSGATQSSGPVYSTRKVSDSPFATIKSAFEQDDSDSED